MNKQILQLAVPNIISNITVPLLGMVDLAIMGHLESEKYIGAIALAGIIFNFIYWGFSFLRMGTSGFTSQAYGREDKQGLVNILSHSLFIAIIGGFILIVLQVPIQNISFYLLKGSNDIEVLATQYFYIRIYAAPATIGLYALNGWFVGMQDAKTPMILAILINVFNIIFNLIFVFVFNLKSDGVALGTVISQYIGFTIAIVFIVKKHKDLLKENFAGLYLNIELLKEFFHVNKNIFIRTLTLITVLSFFTIESAAISDNILAVNTILLQFLLLFSYIMDGFAYSAEALSGRYYGAKDKNSLIEMIKKVFVWGAALAVLFTLVYIIFQDKVLLILTNNKEIIESSHTYLFWIIIIPIVSFAGFLWDGIYIGTTASKLMRNTMLFSAILIFFPVYYLFVNSLGNHALWLAMILFLLARSISQSVLSKKAISIP